MIVVGDRFWDELLQPQPSLLRLTELSSRLNSTIVTAQDLYKTAINASVTGIIVVTDIIDVCLPLSKWLN